ncbi:BMP family protein [Pontibacillus salicampi]|uniref:BMP family protein n=1 Tax=Pontibacillus salicampi TaxID=1449801 RepID=A0ABV6LN25_9BACI
MRKSLLWGLLAVMTMLLAACGSASGQAESLKEQTSIGLVVTESGLGDDSFSDSAIRGLERARDELGILFDYREPEPEDLAASIDALVQNQHELIVGLGFNAQQPIEEMASKYPEQQFILVDGVSEKKNVTSITFKENEGSYLIGLIAGMRTKSNTVGFIGGQKVPLIENFEKGFTSGVKEVNPDAEVLVDYIDTFSDDKKGAATAQKQIKDGADFIFPTAGFAGVGALKKAQEKGIYAFGVDSDQFYIAEEAVVTSMLKRVDTALFDMAKQLDEEQPFTGEHIELGLQENGVGLAPIRVITLTAEQQDRLDQASGKGNNE